jgi:lipopolysaccharide export system protein LptA
MKHYLLALLPLVLAASAFGASPLKSKGPRKTGETVITANRLEYDYAESAILFEENVKVVDPEFTMTADRVIVLMEGTNTLKQVRCLGNVVLVSGDRSARCAEAIFTKATGQIVLTGEAVLQRAKDQIWGRKITIWVDDERMECVPARMVLQPTSVAGDGKRMLP